MDGGVLVILAGHIPIQLGFGLLQPAQRFVRKLLLGLQVGLLPAERGVGLLQGLTQLALHRVQFGLLLFQRGLGGVQLRRGGLRLPALGVQRGGLGLQLVQRVLVGAVHLVENGGEGQQLIQVGGLAQQLDAAAVVHLLHGVHHLFGVRPGLVVLGLFFSQGGLGHGLALLGCRQLGGGLLQAGINFVQLRLHAAQLAADGVDLALGLVDVLLLVFQILPCLVVFVLGLVDALLQIVLFVIGINGGCLAGQQGKSQRQRGGAASERVFLHGGSSNRQSRNVMLSQRGFSGIIQYIIKYSIELYRFCIEFWRTGGRAR